VTKVGKDIIDGLTSAVKDKDFNTRLAEIKLFHGEGLTPEHFDNGLLKRKDIEWLISQVERLLKSELRYSLRVAELSEEKSRQLNNLRESFRYKR